MKKAIQLLFSMVAFITLMPLTTTVHGGLTSSHSQPGFLSPLPQSSPAPPPPRGYTGLDILFIVDQSGSMGGQVFGRDDRPIPNDPNGFRFIATVRPRLAEQLSSGCAESNGYPYPYVFVGLR